MSQHEFTWRPRNPPGWLQKAAPLIGEPRLCHGEATTHQLLAAGTPWGGEGEGLKPFTHQLLMGSNTPRARGIWGTYLYTYMCIVGLQYELNPISAEVSLSCMHVDITLGMFYD